MKYIKGNNIVDIPDNVNLIINKDEKIDFEKLINHGIVLVDENEEITWLVPDEG
ncbi:hypothetical protein [Metabacillus sp. 22489]|uniref:hypothetical protein n=1 Tax=Metabacillus sp. 22489 TaxID=3453928 RepID=UPI003F877048